MDATDQQLLNLIQQSFPATSRPYEALGRLTGITEDDAFKRIHRMRETGVIRRLGGVFDSGKLGYVSTLCAVCVPEGDVDQAASLINALPGVTHHYVRDHRYNLWFTLIEPSQEVLGKTLAQLEKKLQTAAGAGPILSLPAKQVFKIKVQFSV
jgi:siroheme decarboxylase